MSRKLARRLATSGSCARSLEEEIDELQRKIEMLEAECRDKDGEIQRARENIKEWESWNRGISNKRWKRKTVADLDQRMNRL